MEKMKKTIIISIPTCNRVVQLSRLLTSIATQEGLPDDYAFEVLIVNNGAEGDLAPLTSLLNSIPFPDHHIRVSERGYSTVRNAAIEWVLNRRADALIFIDDDEVAPSDWLAKMTAAWEKYNGDVITGPVEQVLPPSTSRLIKTLHLLERNYYAESGSLIKYANSNNTLVSRRVLEAMGPAFHPALNQIGGEDTLFFHQCYLQGFTIYWDNDLLIQEPTLPERAKIAYVIKRWYKYGTNSIYINKILFPNKWEKVSFQLIRATSIVTIKRLLLSIAKLDSRKFGETICLVAKLVGLTSQSLFYSKMIKQLH